MEEEINDERGTSDADLPIATQRNVTNRQLNRKAFLIYPTMPKGRNIDREIKYIQKKFSAIKIDLKCHKMGISKSKKRRLRRKRQEHTRLNKGTPDMNKVAPNPVIVGNAESKNDGIKNKLDVKINILAPETREENKNVCNVYPNNSKQGSDRVSKSPLTLGNFDCVKANLDVLKDNKLTSEIIAKTSKSNENKSILSSNESKHEKDIRLTSRKRKKDEHFSKGANLFPTQNSKPAKENEMSVQSKTESVNLPKINVPSEDGNLNCELSTLKLVESKFFTKTANIFASSSFKSSNHKESIEKRNKTKRSKSKSETSPKKYKPVKIATKTDIDSKYFFQPIKVAKLSADHNMDTKLASQSKSQMASNNSNTTVDNGLYAQKPQRTKRFTKRREKISPKRIGGVPVEFVLDKLRNREFFYYSFEVTGNLNSLRTNDIAFLLNIQNSLPTQDWFFIKRKEISKGTSEIQFVFDRATLTSLEKMQFKASVLRSTVTFVEFVYKKRFLDIINEPFNWLGEWSCFRTVLNKEKINKL
uniref:Uncharacterized protein n=1 Tax=Bactrocera dorsalis TaxID=27457 RepID=A0A034WHG4_BACDO